MKILDLFEGKFKNPELAYHGTSSEFLHSILKNGIVPNPKEKVWDKDEEVNVHMASRVSLRGSYWTTNYAVAERAATSAKMNFGGDKLIVMAHLAKQSAYADEDNISSKLDSAYSDALKDVLGFSNITDTVGKVIEAFNVKPELIKKVENSFIEHLHNDLRGSKKHPVDRNLLKNTFWAMFDRLVAHSASELEYFGYTKRYNFDIPDVQDSEQQLLNIKEQLTRQYRGSVEDESPYNMLKSFRVTSPVTYRGANKIVLIVSEIPEHSGHWYIEYGASNKKAINKFETDYKVFHGVYPNLVQRKNKN